MRDDLIDDWLLVLAGLLNPMFPGEPGEALARCIKPHLRSAFPEYAFTAKSARLVAQAERYGAVPSWDVVAKTLRDYVRSVTPINHGALPAPRATEHGRPGPEEQARIDGLLEAWRRGGAAPVASELPPPVREIGPMVAVGETLHRLRTATRLLRDLPPPEARDEEEAA